ncbi:hypothetical protein OCU04_001476 [Sclerotinia nivalis]|uniref:Cytochrome c oxidase assembly factor 3 mitochondrial coiled-coil domain-containing protein n=1 Tax=Sclerotinia nivalis TaxID=352851 RepID=A0A9X0AY72_9HELO|nr:hypothetical protein OCU04_001476 [Sclerotinia nivalis]
MPLVPKSSYYDKNYKQSAALIRARRPYLVKNALTGAGIFAFALGVCKYLREHFELAHSNNCLQLLSLFEQYLKTILKMSKYQPHQPNETLDSIEKI